jgi:hypothetical protein
MNVRIVSSVLSTCTLITLIFATAMTAAAQVPATCFVPGVQVVADANNPVTAQLDLRAVSAAEPISGDGLQQVVFTLKVENLSPLPAASWNVFFVGPDGTNRFVQMSTLLGNPQFRYGTVNSLIGIPIFNYQGNVQGTYENNGTIRFFVNKSAVGNLAPGQTISVSARTFIVGQLGVGLVGIDETDANSYAIAGNSECSTTRIAAWGLNGDIPVAADYNRNGTRDFAVWRPATGVWQTNDSLTNETNAVAWGGGSLGDIPVTGDFDGDSKADYTVYRPSVGTWYQLLSANNSVRIFQFGVAQDIPLAGDFDGDRIDDITVWRPENGLWVTLNSSDGSTRIVQFGMSEDRPQIGDFDGYRKADITVFRPSNGGWYSLLSSDNSFRGLQFGAGTDVTVPADYDGDGKTDVAVWRPENGTWYILRSQTGAFSAYQWGMSPDRVQPGDYNGNGRADYAVWRPENGVWYVQLN